MPETEIPPVIRGDFYFKMVKWDLSNCSLSDVISLQRLPPGGSWRRKATEGECVNVKFYKAPHSRGLLPSLASSLVTPPSRREAKVRFALNKPTDKSKFDDKLRFIEWFMFNRRGDLWSPAGERSSPLRDCVVILLYQQFDKSKFKNKLS